MRFPYTLISLGLLRETIKRPLIPVQVFNGIAWIPMMAQIDTGSDVSLIPIKMAGRIEGGAPISYVRVPSDGMVVSRKVMPTRIMGITVDLPYAVGPNTIRPVIGRSGFLDRFRVTFNPDSFEVSPV